MSVIKFFKTKCGKILQMNAQTKIYKILNTVEHIGKKISEKEFLDLNPIGINKTEYENLMDDYFSKVEHQWSYKSSDYKRGDVVRHDEYCDKGFYYHWGQVYFCNFKQGDKQDLINKATGKVHKTVSRKSICKIIEVKWKEN